ncbi:hypothetical protein BDZ89DRAFT_1201771 [Hymenopellis radicata]|nr:hypothetical protein BDZ89DRAFT_1201771 [Hymenopellis radicata]
MALPQLSIQTALIGQDIYSDSRTHGFVGPSRNVRLPRACVSGGGAICNNEDGTQCAVAGKESLRVVRVLSPNEPRNVDHISAVGRGGFRAEASRNIWEGSGLKIDSASTDVAWGFGQFNNKILTSARNGELIMWDLNRSKYERRTKDHTRSIHKLSVSHIVQHYCITGSSDADLRIWDIRDLSRSISRIHYPTTIRSLVFSPTSSQPLQVMVGLDNGTIYRWDLKMAQRGQLDRVPVAHTAPVTALDWRPATHSTTEASVGLGWIVSGGLDRTVKVWDLTWPSLSSHIPHKPAYTLHPSFPVRQVLWRPGYDCELAIVSNSEFTTGSNPDMNAPLHRSGSAIELTAANDRKASLSSSSIGDPIEIWDVRRGWIAKWSVTGSAVEGGVTGMTFGDSHAIWTQHSSGMFSQIDLRDSGKPLDSVPRVSATWEASGSLAFVSDQKQLWEAPYDDIPPEQRERMPEQRRAALKALGDHSYTPESQTTGTYNTPDNFDDLEAFSRLAKGYVFDGPDRQQLCAVNAQVGVARLRSFTTRSSHLILLVHAGQVWLLVGASLSDVIPEEKELEPPHAQQTTATTANYAFPATNGVSAQKTSPGRSSELGHQPQRSTSGSRMLTPSSSMHSSPRQGPLVIGTQIPSSLVSRRGSVDSPTSSLGQGRRPSAYRRTSVSIHSASPGGDRSLRHVGEGALDDSDSSGSANGEGGGGQSEEEEVMLRSLVSPTLSATRSAQPSPLSRLVSRTDNPDEDPTDEDEDDDEEDDGSPSPRSTDSEDSDPYSPRPSPSPHLPSRSSSKRSSRGSLNKSKSRSRGSTGGSATLGIRAVTRKASHSSIKTVTVGEPSTPVKGSLKADETIRDLAHTRDKSLAVSDLALDEEPAKMELPIEPSDLTDRRRDLIVEEEKKFRTLAWDALREALEDFANDGDIQMCAMLSLVAGKELRVKKSRVIAFLDAYIDILTRLRLHTCSAYLRKYCETEEVREATLLETTIYTACGRCRKALIVPLGASERTADYMQHLVCSLIARCLLPTSHLLFSRMPVRGLLFQCSICSHGGHHLCYQRYYMQRPMTELPRKFTPVSFDDRGRSVTRSTANTLPLNDDDASSAISGLGLGDSMTDTQRPLPSGNADNLMGHPCAAGCGHYCWAAIGKRDD